MADDGEKPTLVPASDSCRGSEDTESALCYSMRQSFSRASLYMLGELFPINSVLVYKTILLIRGDKRSGKVGRKFPDVHFCRLKDLKPVKESYYCI